MLYNHPSEGIHDWRNEINPTLLRTVKEGAGPIAEWDINAYLLPETYDVCQRYFEEIQFNSQSATLSNALDRTNPFVQIYLGLRTKLQEYVEQGRTPQLGVVSGPTGAYNWTPSQIQLNEVLTVDLDLDQDD